MSIAGLIIDLVAVGVAVLIIVLSIKRGAVKTLLTLFSGIASLLSAYAFSPALSAYLEKKVFLPMMTDSISDTVASLCESGKDAAQNVVYDVSKLIGNSQFISLVEKYGADPDKTEKTISGISDGARTAVDKVSETVARPISGVISDVIAFIAVLAVSFIVFKLITFIVCLIFKLPGLKAMDKTGGLVLGIVGAVFFLLVYSMLVSALSSILTKVASSSFPEDIVERSFLIRILAKYNVITVITEALGFLNIQ